VDTASEGFSDMTSGELGGHKSHGRKAVVLEWDIYDDNIQKARTGWKNVP
jgi:hypothetical protein